MPQPDNRRERGAGTKMPGGNAVAPSGVSGEFNKDGAAMVGALASVMGNTEPQIKIGQQGRIIDNGTGLYAALEGAAKGTANALEQYDKMYQYTSKKIFNDWDTSRLAYSATVNNSPSKMKEWTQKNAFKANDVNAKEYNTIIATTNLKDYDQYEIERYNRIAGEASNLTAEAGQARIAEAMAQTDSASPAMARFQSDMRSYNSRLVASGITARVMARKAAGLGEIFDIGTRLRELGVSPGELGGEHGNTIAHALMLWGNRPSAEDGQTGIHVTQDGIVRFSNGHQSFDGAFNGDLNENLMFAIREEIGLSYDPNDQERFDMTAMAMGVNFNAAHTSRHGNGSNGQPSSGPATRSMYTATIFNTFTHTSDPVTVIETLHNSGLPPAVTPEAWAAAGETGSLQKHNTETLNKGLATIVEELNNKTKPANMSDEDFYFNRAVVASNLTLFLNNKDTEFFRSYNPMHELTDTNLLKKLDLMRTTAFGNYAAELSAGLDFRVNNIGRSPNDPKWVGTPENPGKYPDGLPIDMIPVEQQNEVDNHRLTVLSQLQDLGMEYQIMNLGSDGQVQTWESPDAFNHSDKPQTPTMLVIKPSTGHMSGVSQPLVTNPDEEGITGDGIIFIAGSATGLAPIQRELVARAKRRRQRENATRVMQSLSPRLEGEPGTTSRVIDPEPISKQNVTDATKWWMDYGLQSGRIDIALALTTPGLGRIYRIDPKTNRAITPMQQSGSTPLYVTAIEAIVENDEYLEKITRTFDFETNVTTADGLRRNVTSDQFFNAVIMAEALAASGHPTFVGKIADVASDRPDSEAINEGGSSEPGARADQKVRVLNHSIWSATNTGNILRQMDYFNSTPERKQQLEVYLDPAQGTQSDKRKWLKQMFQDGDEEFKQSFWMESNRLYRAYKGGLERRRTFRQPENRDALGTVFRSVISNKFDDESLVNASLKITELWTNKLDSNNPDSSVVTAARRVFKDYYDSAKDSREDVFGVEGERNHVYTLTNDLDSLGLTRRTKGWVAKNPFDAAALGMFGVTAQTEAIGILIDAQRQRESQIMTHPDGKAAYLDNARGDSGADMRLLTGVPDGRNKHGIPSSEALHGATSTIPSDRSELSRSKLTRDAIDSMKDGWRLTLPSGTIPVARTQAAQRMMFGGINIGALANPDPTLVGYEVTQRQVEWMLSLVRGAADYRPSILSSKSLKGESLRSRASITNELVYTPNGASRDTAIIKFNDKAFEDPEWIEKFVNYCVKTAPQIEGASEEELKKLWTETVLLLRGTEMSYYQRN